MFLKATIYILLQLNFLYNFCTLNVKKASVKKVTK